MLKGPFNNIDEALEYLDYLGSLDDENIDLFEGALALSVQNHPGISLDKYRNHRIRLADDCRETHEKYLNEGNADNLASQIWALAEVYTRKHGYIGDDLRYNDLQNADIIRVIDRRLGLPIALSLLCVMTGQDLGWDVVGMNFPAHFVVRVQKDGAREIIDPFQGCIVLKAPDLRKILKKTLGENAELSANYYEPASRRDTLIRLQNNVKHRQIEAEDYLGALANVDLMKRLAPHEYRLDLDAGVLLARLERPVAAIEALERYVSQVPDPRDKQDAALLLQELRTTLN